MARSRLALALLVLVVSLVSATAFDWTFWNDDDDKTPAPTTKKTTTTKAPSTTAPTIDSSATSGSSSLDDLVAAASASGSLELDESGSGSFIDASAIEVNATLASVIDATNEIKSTYRNWVGPRPVSADAACYRESHFMDTCPTNFDRNKATGTCWAECPIAYPVECGMECIRQNDDCLMEVLNKVGAVANSALAIASFGAAQKLWQVAKGVTRAFDCANMMIGTMRSIIRYVRNIKTTDPTASTDKILNIMYQSNNIVTDLPIAVYLCMGWELPRPLDISGRVLTTMNWILLNAIAYKDDIVSSWSKFKAFLIGANFTEAANSINETEIGTLSDALKSKSTCGYDLRALTDRTWNTVNQLRVDNPGISEDDLRLKMQDTQLMTSDIAIVTNNCMEQLIEESDESTAYKTREKIRIAFNGMINQLVSKGKSNNGSSENAQQFMYTALSKTLISIAVTGFDLIGVMGMIAAYLQTICGPTNFIGEIDDGTDPRTLGLTTIQKAFNGSSMSWTKKGDGAVLVNFKSTDTKDVTVNIMSGGDKIDEVDVKAGGSAKWVSNVTALAGKTLYMDRWRPGFLGLPGTGGGSLLLWVPHASQGGHLELEVKLNVS
ncbi:Flavoprotein YCP4 [Phytophthora cinnamomi]|uniref:Flavoprotein YCP4 n=1 Tax=Phytophthora cinnamomi TaxID=4785 RepID=UPI00355A695D|nr:Flavoprotein YCP4 [Phytophthora cinnamomi]